MQAFRIREDARTWFRDLRGNTFKTDFDAFYFCFMAGIAERRKQSPATGDTAELVTYFPDRYAGRGQLLVALFLTRELEQLGVALTEKRAVHAAIAKLIHRQATNMLSDDGVREFNKYAHGGYDVLLDWFDDRPRSIDTFVRTFKRKLDGVISAGLLD